MSWTKQDQAKLREYQTAQKTVAEIAQKMDRPIDLIRAELEAMGYKPIESKPAPEPSEFLKEFKAVEINKKPYARITPEIEKSVVLMREEGKTIRQIAEKAGISTASVNKILTRHSAKNSAQEGNPKPARINVEFDAAVTQMIEEAKEKEPASLADNAGSEKQDITPVIPVINDITPEAKCQEPGINAAVMATLLLTMIDEAFGRECEPTGIKADRDHLDLSFTYEGKEYYIVFGQARHYEYDVSGGERV